jgi:hypothetical protein
MPAKIDWDDLRIGYNRIYKTEFKTVTIFLKTVLENDTYADVSRRLGVSIDTIRRKRREIREQENVEILTRQTSVRNRFKFFTPEQTANMTKLEIAEELGCSCKCVEMLAREFKRQYIRVLNGGVYYADQKRCYSL